MLGISLFIPIFLVCPLYVDLAETVLLFSDMNFEEPEDEDSSTCENEFKVFMPSVTCQNEFKVFVPVVSPKTLPPKTHFSRESSLFSSPLTSYTQITPVLRC